MFPAVAAGVVRIVLSVLAVVLPTVVAGEVKVVLLVLVVVLPAVVTGVVRIVLPVLVVCFQPWLLQWLEKYYRFWWFVARRGCWKD